MGAQNEKLPANVNEKVLRLFNLIDLDNSQTLEKDETLKFWSKNFPKINSHILFDQVDTNKDGTIQLNEWIEFWKLVYNSGYKEEEICEELDNMIDGGSWVMFETGNKYGRSKKAQSLKSEGKC